MLRRHRSTPTAYDPPLSVDLANWVLAEIAHLKGDSK